MKGKSRLLDISLLTLATAGPALYLAGLLSRGLALLHGDLTRVGLMMGLLLSGGAAPTWPCAARRAPCASWPPSPWP